MATSDLEPKDVRDVGSNNTTDDHIASIWKQLIFSSDDGEDVVLKDTFVIIRGENNSLLVTIGVDDAPKFPLVWTNNPPVINGYNYTCLTACEAQVVLTLDGFKVMQSYIVIILDQEDDEFFEKLKLFSQEDTC
ncbi:hypothetical protein KIW84_072130 [Lathyrus oleraceus]|uniref:Uncharacterized protein n=1 Tax=Pisum sativum TaxID=3888 RepID=A0A9D4VM59_PEA|nr:hypothetical protein KIW84_072130 [Pisum sativum]